MLYLNSNDLHLGQRKTIQCDSCKSDPKPDQSDLKYLLCHSQRDAQRRRQVQSLGSAATSRAV